MILGYYVVVAKKKVIFLLAGGLGNQLFQIVAALSLIKDKEIYVDSAVSKARMNKCGNPEVTAFTLPKRIQFMKKRRGSWLVSKSTGYISRMHSSPRAYEKVLGVKYGLILLANLINLVYFHSFRKVSSPTNVGFSDYKIPPGNVVVAGLFQSYKWAEDKKITDQIQSIRILNEGPDLRKYIELASSERPIVVHIRLGDYKNLNKFGTLSETYYREAIPLVRAKVQVNSIWVFSDEVNEAQRIFNFNEFALPIRWIQEVDNSPASTLELMRYGTGYVIANSTFSWWAAFLSYSTSACIAAPKKWFREMQDPNSLIPPNWIRVDSF